MSLAAPPPFSDRSPITPSSTLSCCNVVNDNDERQDENGVVCAGISDNCCRVCEGVTTFTGMGRPPYRARRELASGEKTLPSVGLNFVLVDAETGDLIQDLHDGALLDAEQLPSFIAISGIADLSPGVGKVILHFYFATGAGSLGPLLSGTKIETSNLPVGCITLEGIPYREDDMMHFPSTIIIMHLQHKFEEESI